jgi:hypothetical protein
LLVTADATRRRFLCTAYLAAIGAAAAALSDADGCSVDTATKRQGSQMHRVAPNERRKPPPRAFADAVKEVLTAG